MYTRNTKSTGYFLWKFLRARRARVYFPKKWISSNVKIIDCFSKASYHLFSQYSSMTILSQQIDALYY